MLKSPTNNYILKEQIDVLFNSSLSGGLLNIFGACLIYYLLKDSAQQSAALTLCMGIAVFAIVRLTIASQYLKSQKKHIKRYLVGYSSLTFLIGCTWAFFQYSQVQYDNNEVRNVIFLINFGLIAGSVAVSSVWLPAYFTFVIPQSVAIFLVFIATGSSEKYFIAFTFFIFMAVMIATSISVNRRYKKEIELTHNNKDLINDLNNEIEIRERTQLELEKNKEDLENKVEERTRELVDINSNLENVIKKKEQAEGSLQYLAYHDELTGLPNRNLLIDRINHSIEVASRTEKQLGILFLDLDRFKAINDSLGHLIGDKLIKQVSDRLLKTLRKEDTISRNGGDEFVVVIQRMVNSDEIIGIAQKLIENLTEIFDIDSHKIHIGASIGISLYPHDGKSALELIRNADTAMFSAKKAGGNRLQFYDESMSNRLRERLQIETELHTAIAKNEFYLAYQPQVDCLTGETIGFEALLRWENEKLGQVGPNQFISLLEETGLIYDVGEWVIKDVISFIGTGGIGSSVIAVNLSALQCGNMDFVDYLQQQMSETGINPAQLEFEITESLLINDFEKAEVFLNKIHELGCSIALDDFGTGYTSMSYLTRLPIDCIKVDQSFVRDIDTSATLENIVRAIVNMSDSLGVKNVFEGVETEAELNVIKKLNGRIVQGYLYSAPLKIENIGQWVAGEHTDHTGHQEKIAQ